MSILYLLCVILYASANSEDLVLENTGQEVPNKIHDAVEESQEESQEITFTDAVVEYPEININDNGIEDNILEYERLADIADKSNSPMLLEEEVEKLFSDMVRPLHDIMILLKDPTNIYKFIEARGIERVVLPHLHINHTELRSYLLDLMRLLFDIAPTTTSVMTPTAVLDKLLDIFEEDDDIVIKAITVEILNSWLPDNPKMQARVMKLKGLEPFYDQVNKLDASTINKLMKLFSKILAEHFRAWNDDDKKTRSDFIKANVYKKIGLVERVGTEDVCLGLLNIFQSTWSHSLDNQDFLVPVFEIMKNVESSCVDYYKGKEKALSFFQDLLKYVTEGASNGELDGLDVNLTDIKEVLKKYVDYLSLSVKDEF